MFGLLYVTPAPLLPACCYLQGMNLLVAVSLFYLDEESAFWCLVAIVEKVLPSDYYTHGLLSSQADQVRAMCVCV